MPSPFSPDTTLRPQTHLLCLVVATAIVVVMTLASSAPPTPLAAASGPLDATCPALRASDFDEANSAIHSRLYLPAFPQRERWSPVTAPGTTVTACHTILNASDAAIDGLYLEIVNLTTNNTVLTFTPRLFSVVGPDNES